MKKIKKSQLALGLLALTIIGAAGISSATLAAGTENSAGNTVANITSHFRMNKGANNLENGMTQGEREANRTANQAEREVRKAAVETALAANDYNAWVAAEGANAPILKTINASNFSRFVEAHNLRQQADAIMTELGVTKGEGRGMGMGMGGQFDAK